MRVDSSSQAFGFVARAGAPTLSVSDEETLLRRESFNRFQRLAFGIVLPCHVSQNQPAQIGNIFAQGQLPVDLDNVHNHILRILIRDATGALLKRFGILRSPPVAQVAVGIELTAFIVEAVREFMADGASSVAEVGSRVRISIE